MKGNIVKRKNAVEVATVVRGDTTGPRNRLVGCSIPLQHEHVRISDVILIVEELQRAGAEQTVLNCDCGKLGRVSAVASVEGQLFSTWPLKMRCSLESMRMLQRTELSVSDSHTQRTLKVRA